MAVYFICAKCGCIEKPALGHFYGRDELADMMVWTEDNIKYKGLPLCSECMPKVLVNGEKSKGANGWHGRFKRITYDQFKLLPGGKQFVLKDEYKLVDQY